MKDLLGAVALFLMCAAAGWGIFKFHCWRGHNPFTQLEFKLPDRPEIRVIDYDEAKRLVNHVDILVLDARASLFYESGHLPGAISLPRGTVETDPSGVVEWLRGKNKKAFLVYCSDAQCEDSKRVALLLNQQGLTPLLIYTGGWAEWNGRR
ncbi:MAG: rhodanese-like domain-containing protein [Verrucomicrobiales bacterium]|nr:rhodanese-like domain-containing protein [Verrucomicrobiales bacterium]